MNIQEKIKKHFGNNLDALLDGDQQKEFFLSFTKPPVTGLRVNTLKISVEDFLKIAPFELTPVPWSETGFYIDNDHGIRPGKHPYYYAGLYYLQEPSAMLPAEILHLTASDELRVLDLCAAPGGKSTQLAAIMQNKGCLVVNDNSPKRTMALLSNLMRMGVTNAVVYNRMPETLTKVFDSYFTHILIDAPCSGEGMFRREPEAIEKLSLYPSGQCHAMQKEILQASLQMIDHEGMICYSTCTFNQLENEDHIDWMTKMEGVSHKISNRIWPHLQKGEGQYAALFSVKKPEKNNSFKYKGKPYRSLLLDQFIEQTIMPSYYRFFDPERITESEGKLYLTPVRDLNFSQVKPAKPGLFLGELKKNRFEPSADLALALPAGAFCRVVSLSSADSMVYSYLRGETLLFEYPDSGWTIVATDGFPLGWAKKDVGHLKNYYSKQLRRMD